ncbi:MAG: hypothetical protein R8G34_13815 [Paracoccaceae bacterium]|nr:hypothetical protein [Paracoccaceae bacterium]
MKLGFGIGILCLGSVIINTMPVWVGNLSRNPEVGDGLAGAFASLVLFSAALTCAGLFQNAVSYIARYALPLAFAALAFGEHWHVTILAGTCIGLGVSMGSLTQEALHAIRRSEKSLTSIGLAMSIGLVVSLVFYLMLPLFDLSPFWFLFLLSLPIVALRGTPFVTDGAGHVSTGSIRAPTKFIGFFVMMGAYWTFLELYGARFNNGDAVALWLLASLVSGACGSILAARLPGTWQSKAQKVGLSLAAASGAASYVAQDISVFGITILVNAFALFLFFPIYLQTAGERMPQAMAGYLVGFAAGGLAGAVLVKIGGYQLMALALLLSGFIALIPRSRRSFLQ